MTSTGPQTTSKQKQRKIKKSKKEDTNQKITENEKSIENYLIPTSTEKNQNQNQNQNENENENQNQRLKPMSSNFYCLPIFKEDEKRIMNLYISSKFKFSRMIEKDEKDEKDKGSSSQILIKNLNYLITKEEIQNLFSFNFKMKMNEIEVDFIDEEEEEEEDWLTRFSRINWIQRELEIQRLVIKSKEVEKLRKKGSKKALPSDSVQLQIPSLINEVDHFNLHSNRLLKNAVVRFKSSDQLHQLLSIDPSNLPLKWPSSSSSSSVIEHDQSSWLSKYRTQRKSLRPSYESVKAHTDAWMIASDSGQIKPLSLISKGKSGKKGSEEAAEEEAEDEMKVDEDDGEGEWITVTRGGQHGRSSTIPTQPKEIKGADPYAQSSMSGRDSLAGVKVMKRGFLEAFKQDELQDHQSKRKGGELNTGFYKTNVNENKRLKMFELRKKFDEDKARVERMKNSRKFKPY